MAKTLRRHLATWLTALAITLPFGWSAAYFTSEERAPHGHDTPDGVAQPGHGVRRDQAAARACGGRPFEWAPDGWVQCFRELPRPPDLR